jgi:predicted acetyltransferase
MEIRLIKPDEQIQYAALCQICFLDIGRRDIREQRRNPPEERPDHGGRTGSPVWAAFEDGEMVSAMTVNPYVMRMNGHEVKMGGIGAVATRPESRGKGYIKKINYPMFEAMIAEGQIYSFLYPFSFEYYRNFGYEHCFHRRTATIPISQFAKFPYPERFVAHEPEDSNEPFARIYEEFARDRNLSIVRSEHSWKWMLNRDPYMKLQFTYLNYDANGVPNAYLLHDREKVDGSNVIRVRELAWTTPEGLHAVFGFFGKMGSGYKSVRWIVPCDVNVQAILPDPYSVEWSTRAAGMNRVMDVPAVLALQPAPKGNGRVSIGITDHFWTSNTGLYHLEWENGNLTVKKTDESFTHADMETNVTTLAQLTTGYINAAESVYRKDTVIRSAKNELADLFPKKKLYLLEGF